MATITSAQAGNWSDTYTWVGGVIPSGPDDVRLNHTVTADVDISINSFLTPSSNNAGYLIVSTSRNITCTGNISHSKYLFSSAALIDVSAGTGSVVTINAATITAIQGSVSFEQAGTCIRVSSSATVNINANIIGGYGISLGGTYGGWPIRLTGAGSVVNINGILTTSAISSTGYSNCVLSDSGAKTINITGTLVSNLATVVASTVNDTIAVNGIISSVSTNAITSTSATSLLRVSGVIINTGSRIGIYAPRVELLLSAPTQWLFQTNDVLTDKTLYTADELTGYPPEAKVENGEVYGPSSEFTGTLDPVTISTGQVADISNAIALHITPQVLSAITGLP